MENFSLKSIFKRFFWKISFTFLLLISENVAKVLQPFVLGLAINDLISSRTDGLWLFCGLYLASFVIGTVRRYYDTRAYATIYATVASEMAAQQNKKNTAVSTISARSSLVKELVDFFEHDVTGGFTALIGVIGALIMLSLFNLWVFAGCLLTVLIIVVIYLLSNRRIYKYNIELNDELENRIAVLESRDNPGISKHFSKISHWMQKLSDLETINFGIIEILLFALAIFTLYVTASSVGATAGGIFSVLTYVLEFSEGVFTLPIILQQVIRLKEISTRLKKV